MDDIYIRNICDNLDFTSNLLNDIGNGILLTNKEIEVLNKYCIDYKSCTSLKNVIAKIEQVLSEDQSNDLEDLDYIVEAISERDYYQNTNK